MLSRGGSTKGKLGESHSLEPMKAIFPKASVPPLKSLYALWQSADMRQVDVTLYFPI